MDGNHTYLLQEYKREIIRVLLPIDILYSVILLVGVVGNIFVIVIYALQMKKDQRESRYFIPILAFYDIMVCILSEIYFLYRTFFWTAFHSDELCKTLLFFLVQTKFTSDAFLLAIAIQRYIMICRSLGKQMTLFWRRITMVSVIAANIVYSIPVTIVSGVKVSPLVYRNETITGEHCSLANEKYPTFQLAYAGILIFIGVANIVVTSAMYMPIACVIYRRLWRSKDPTSSSPCSEENARRIGTAASRTKESCVSTSQDSIAPSLITEDREEKAKNKHKTERRTKHNFNMMFFVIVFVYVVTTAMTAMRRTVLRHDDATSSDHTNRFYLFLVRVYVFNHVANPFIYAYFDSGMRSSLTNLFRKSSAT